MKALWLTPLCACAYRGLPALSVPASRQPRQRRQCLPPPVRRAAGQPAAAPLLRVTGAGQQRTRAQAHCDVWRVGFLQHLPQHLHQPRLGLPHRAHQGGAHCMYGLQVPGIGCGDFGCGDFGRGVQPCRRPGNSSPFSQKQQHHHHHNVRLLGMHPASKWLPQHMADAALRPLLSFCCPCKRVLANTHCLSPPPPCCLHFSLPSPCAGHQCSA